MTIVTKSARRVRRTVARWLGFIPASSDFEILNGPPPADIGKGWQNPDLPQKQWNAFAPILEDLRSGRSRKDFLALAEAVQSTAVDDPLILEIGCGSGWNSEILKALVKYPVRYVGSDYSFDMVKLGRSHYAGTPFVVCDAASLPFPDASCDIALSGTALMHILEYRKAISESRRISRRFAIFHTVPVHSRRDTTILRKRAYGEWVVEIVFNEGQLLEVFSDARLRLRQTFESIPYDLVEVTGEHSVTKTYVCEVI
jgi:ubiquinone/menaquinone biosynthesis C-methylase UbiE